MDDFVLHFGIGLSEFIEVCNSLVIGSIKNCGSNLIIGFSKLLLDLLGHNSEDPEIDFIL